MSTDEPLLSDLETLGTSLDQTSNAYCLQHILVDKIEATKYGQPCSNRALVTTKDSNRYYHGSLAAHRPRAHLYVCT
jgi:hypothetical protein